MRTRTLRFLTAETGQITGITRRLFSEKNSPRCQLIYDGSCPACKMTMDAIPDKSKFELINARDGSHPLVKKLEEKGYDFDKGMAIIKENGEVAFGASALKTLGEIDGRQSLKFAGTLGSFFYPGLRKIRDLLVGNNTIGNQRISEKASDSSPTPANKK